MNGSNHRFADLLGLGEVHSPLADLEDPALIKAYVQQHSQAAFTALVQRHIDFVYAMARRKVTDHHLAEDVTQAVFIILAQKASTMNERTPLPVWLFRVTRYACANARKKETRRQFHEQAAREAMSRHNAAESATGNWEEVAPLLDDAVAALNETDRRAVILRFYSQRSWRDVGAALDVSEKTAFMRVDRAMDKLRAILTRKGVAIAGAGLTTLIAAHTAPAAPTTLAQGTSSLALAAVGHGTVTTSAAAIAKGATAMMTWVKVQLTAAVIGVAILAGGAGAVVIQQTLATPAQPGPVAAASRAIVQPPTPAPPPAPPVVAALQPASLPAASDDADLRAVRAVVQARLEQLINLLSTYEVTTRYAQEERTVGPVDGRGSIIAGGTHFEQKSLDLLGALSSYESTLIPEKSQGLSERMLSMQQHSIAKFHEDRTERLQLSRDGASIPRGAIVDPAPLPEPDLEVALGLRAVHSQSRLDAAALRAMQLERIDAQHVKLMAKKGRVQDEWILDNTAGYAPVSYQRRVDGTHADFELTVDQMIKQNGLMLPQSATLTQKSWYEGTSTTVKTETIVATDYRVSDPQNTPDRYEMKWPGNTEMRDYRGRGISRSGGPTGQPTVAPVQPAPASVTSSTTTPSAAAALPPLERSPETNPQPISSGPTAIWMIGLVVGMAILGLAGIVLILSRRKNAAWKLEKG